MLGDGKCLDALVETVGSCRGNRLVYRTAMPGKGVGESVVTEVLMILVCVALLCLGRVEESEAKIVVGGLIPSVPSRHSCRR